mmetsp:Transcript_8377/g.33990  ORF Transcript_8377/g.33990 Transcript_8377/m.33990 type:complete len:442 (-) Transcript_8377:179-1504(-)
MAALAVRTPLAPRVAPLAARFGATSSTRASPAHTSSRPSRCSILAAGGISRRRAAGLPKAPKHASAAARAAAGNASAAGATAAGSGSAEPYDVQWMYDELESLLSVEVREEYAAEIDAGVRAIVAWRARYAGDSALWRRLTKRDKRGGTKMLKELCEYLPVLRRCAQAVEAAAADPELAGRGKLQVLDLASGKGYLAMFLSEMLPASRVSRIVLVDSAFPPMHAAPGPQHISIEHITGSNPQTGEAYNADPADGAEGAGGGGSGSGGRGLQPVRGAYPIRLDITKKNLKKRRQLRDLGERVCGAAPTLILGVHLCGTLALRAVDLFNNCPDTALALALKPCCLPAAQADDARGRTFTIGEHTFAAREVTARGKWVSRNVKASTWRGPPRHHLKERFGRWSEHLLAGMVADDKSMDIVEVQAHGYQNTFLWASRLGAEERPL